MPENYGYSNNRGESSTESNRDTALLHYFPSDFLFLYISGSSFKCILTNRSKDLLR